MSRRSRLVSGPLIWLGAILFLFGAYNVFAMGFVRLETNLILGLASIGTGLLSMIIATGVVFRRRWSFFLGLFLFASTAGVGSYLFLQGFIWWGLNAALATAAFMLLVFSRAEFRKRRVSKKDYSRRYSGRFSR